MRCPEVIHRQLWITGISDPYLLQVAAHLFRAPSARQRTDRDGAAAHIELGTVRRLRLSFCKRNRCYLVKTISATPDSGIELKCFMRLLVQCGGV